MKPQTCRSCHTDHKGRECAHRRARQAAVRPCADRLRAARQARQGRVRQVPRAGEEVLGRPPADCNACHKKDDVHKGSLGTKCADCHTENDWKEAKFDHDKTRFPLTGQARRHQVRRLSQEGHRLQGRAAHLHRLPQEGRQRQPRATRASTARSATAATTPRPGSRRPSTTTATPSTRCAASTARPSAPTATPGNSTRTSSARPASIATRRTTTASRATRAAWAGTAPPATARAAGRKRASSTTTRPSSRCWASTSTSSATTATRARTTRKRRRTATAATRRTTSTRQRSAPSARPATSSATGRPRARASITTRREFKLRNAHAAKTVQVQGLPQGPEALPRHADGLLLPATRRTTSTRASKARSARRATTTRTGRRPFRPWPDALSAAGQAFKVECKDCHKSPRFKDAKIACVSCHLKDDVHKKTLGPACEQCHNARNWKAWDFDHDKRTKYAARRQAQGRGMQGLPQPADGSQGQRVNALRQLPCEERCARRQLWPAVRAMPRDVVVQDDPVAVSSTSSGAIDLGSLHGPRTHATVDDAGRGKSQWRMAVMRSQDRRRVVPLAGGLRMRCCLCAWPRAAVRAGAVAQSGTTGFDHLTTGFLLTGLHQDVRCETCHIKGIFKVTPRDCATCHMQGNPRSASPSRSSTCRPRRAATSATRPRRSATSASTMRWCNRQLHDLPQRRQCHRQVASHILTTSPAATATRPSQLRRPRGRPITSRR